MKDITHYLVDSKNSDSVSLDIKEVSVKRAKNDDATDTKTRKKHGRVKIKLSRKPSESTVCKILENSTDLIDKTPSPYLKSKKKQEDSKGNTPKRKTRIKSNIESKVQSNSSQINEQNKNDTDPKSQNDFILKKNKNTSLSEHYDNSAEKIRTIRTEKDILNKNMSIFKQKEIRKLRELANEEYSKQKLIEKNETVKTEKILQRKKKILTLETKKDITDGDENNPKNNDSNDTKHSYNLLNYFSKATPERLEEERLMKKKVIVKAEIHTPKIFPVSVPVTDKKKKGLSIKKELSNLKQVQNELDEICIINSETLILSPENKKIKSPLQQNKPKWSLKIQLQSNTNANLLDIADDEEITPTFSMNRKNENVKSSKKIPKILLPIKNKKGDLVSLMFKADKGSNKKKEKNNFKMVDKKPESEYKAEQFDSHCTIKQCKTNTIILESEVEDDGCHKNPLKRKSNKRLAPLFIKRMKSNSEIIATRKLFFQSDVNENNDNYETKKPILSKPVILPFPKLSHINQLSADNYTLSQVYSFSLRCNKICKPSFLLSHMKTILKLNETPFISQILCECVKPGIEIALCEIKSHYSDISTLWNTIATLPKFKNCKQIKNTNDKKNSKQSNDNLNEVRNSPWTDKYKPSSSSDIVGNEEAALKLKSWLVGWKSLKINEDYSSSEEFCISDCSTSSSIENNQVAVLIGPHGSGKTASVYAIAQELGYKVLEVNASSKRPGKKILKEFEEATKSHRVKKSNYQNIFNSLSKKVEETKKICQNSLILMEDVDVVFEEDEGFISATFQLASNTKRPIVMTLRDTCSHLSKLAPEQFQIIFQPVNGKKAIALLQLIALAETGYNLPLNCINILFQNGDLRKCLLQLQYLLLPGKERISLTSLVINNSSWSDMKTYIYKPAIKLYKGEKKKQAISDKNFDKKILDKLVHNLDNFSVMSRLINIEDPTSHIINLKFEPCMSFTENRKTYSSLENTSLEIGYWLNNAIKKSAEDYSKKPNIQVDTNYQFMSKKEINNSIDSILSQITSNVMDRRIVAADYLPSIRTICRAEEIRNQSNSKRGNRFFHYLQSFKLTSETTKSSNILSAACQMLQEKSPGIEGY